MKYLKKDLYISISEKNEENYNFIIKVFRDIPLTFKDYLEREHIYVCEARINNKLVGVNIFNIRPKNFWSNEPNLFSIPTENSILYSNYTVVDNNYRGMGINTKIKKYLIKYAKNKGVGAIAAGVKPDNIASYKSLLNLGFIKIPKLNSSGNNTYYLVL